MPSVSACPTIINRNPHEISLVNFTIIKDSNALNRVSGTTAMSGAVENGAVKFGKNLQTNITNSTNTMVDAGEWQALGNGRR
jgi:hypothetical protein